MGVKRRDQHWDATEVPGFAIENRNETLFDRFVLTLGAIVVADRVRKGDDSALDKVFSPLTPVGVFSPLN